MSIDVCRCGAYVDTDADPECYADEWTGCLCERCREPYEDDEMSNYLEDFQEWQAIQSEKQKKLAAYPRILESHHALTQKLETLREINAELLAALKGMTAHYRNRLVVHDTILGDDHPLHVSENAIAKAEANG